MLKRQWTTSTATYPRLAGSDLWLSRAVWALVMGLTALLLLRFIPQDTARYNAEVAAQFGSGLAELGIATEVMGVFLIGRIVLLMAIFAAVSVLIFWRRSDNRFALIVSGGLVIACVNLLFIETIQTPGVVPLQDHLIGLLAAALAVLATVFDLGMFLLLPDGVFVPRWGRWLLAWALVSAGVLLLIPVPESTGIINGVGAVFLLPAIYAQVYRYRSAARAQRKQIRWVLAGLLIVGMGFLFHMVMRPLLLEVVLGDVSEPARQVIDRLTIYNVFSATSIAIPVTLAIAMLRYRLWDVDIFLTRSLSYAMLSVVLGLVYVGGVVLLQQILESVTGRAQSSAAAAASALVIAAVFRPAQARLQQLVNRSFPAETPLVETEMQADTLPRRISSYVLLEPIGKGGMAEVFRGRHETLERDVAVKILSPAAGTVQQFRVRFEREARTVAALQHPNIVRIHDYGSSGSDLYMIMDYISGGTLADLLARRECLTLPEALPIIRDISAALDFAHLEGVVHRDIKPSNVLLLREADGGVRQAVLTDFGVAKMVAGNQQITQSGIIGTVDYLAPEQIRSEPDVDQRADVYAFGVMVFQMLTGRMPYVSDNLAGVLFAHLQAQFPDPRTYAPDLSESTANAILRACSKDRDDRYHSAGAFAAALAE